MYEEEEEEEEIRLFSITCSCTIQQCYNYNVGRLPMAGIKSTACREPPRNVCYFDATDVVMIECMNVPMCVYVNSIIQLIASKNTA